LPRRPPPRCSTRGRRASPPSSAPSREAGYDVAEEEAIFAVEGMHCASCAEKLDQALRLVPGVLDAHVNVASGEIRLRAIAGTVDRRGARGRRGAAGAYRLLGRAETAAEVDVERAARAEEEGDVRRRFWVAAVLAAAVMVLSFHHEPAAPRPHPRLLGERRGCSS